MPSSILRCNGQTRRGLNLQPRCSGAMFLRGRLPPLQHVGGSLESGKAKYSFLHCIYLYGKYYKNLGGKCQEKMNEILMIGSVDKRLALGYTEYREGRCDKRLAL